MRPFTLTICVVLMFFTACSPAGATPQDSPVQPMMYPSLSILDYFPLKQGAYWVYKGNVKWTKVNSSDIVEKEITWKMEVQRVFQRNNIMGYEMLGAPWDLAWYEEGKEPTQYGIIQTGGKFYRTSSETIIRLMNEDDTLIGLVDENDIFLDIPLLEGKKFCDTMSLARSDNMYCWVVGKEKPAEVANIAGADPTRGWIEYSLYNQTMPDHSIIGFIPGIGISHYVYGHHGTVSEVDVQLIEYHIGK